MKNILADKEKEIFLSYIFEAEYRQVMKLHLDGYAKEDIAENVGYSVRQVQRIIQKCWKNVCIMLLQDKAKERENNVVY